jgi:hypothetical protein
VRPLCQERCFLSASHILTLLCVALQYGLGDNSNYMKAVVDTIVAKVQGVPGDDIAVLLLGYQGTRGGARGTVAAGRRLCRSCLCIGCSC